MFVTWLLDFIFICRNSSVTSASGFFRCFALSGHDCKSRTDVIFPYYRDRGNDLVLPHFDRAEYHRKSILYYSVVKKMHDATLVRGKVPKVLQFHTIIIKNTRLAVKTHILYYKRRCISYFAFFFFSFTTQDGGKQLVWLHGRRSNIRKALRQIRHGNLLGLFLSFAKFSSFAPE